MNLLLRALFSFSSFAPVFVLVLYFLCCFFQMRKKSAKHEIESVKTILSYIKCPCLFSYIFRNMFLNFLILRMKKAKNK